MTKTKSTKRALLLSALSLLMCVSMLIGSTFAWFSDTTSSAGNTIQSGKLEIVLEKNDGSGWVNAEGQTINFRTHENSTFSAENILWEPGCTYWMEHIRVNNTGNLALKYDIVISGMTGDTELLDVIKFEYYIEGKDWQPLDTIKGELLPETTSDSIIIRAHMDEDAGNDYQDLKLSGISVAVSAQQLPYEYDTLGKDYDKYIETLAGGYILNNGNGARVAVEVLSLKGITGPESFYINILDASGNVMNTIKPAQKTIEALTDENGVFKGATACAYLTYTDSWWDISPWGTLDANNAPAKAVLYVNGVEKGSCNITAKDTTWAAVVTEYNANN